MHKTVLPAIQPPVDPLSEACAELDALTHLLSKAGESTVSCAHMTALLVPLNARLQAAHERLDMSVG